MQSSDILHLLREPKLKQHLIAQAIDHIWIAGSFARGNHHETSDIDLVVQLNEDRLTTSYFTLPRYLQPLLGNRTIDLLDIEYLNKHSKESILSNRISVW